MKNNSASNTFVFRHLFKSDLKAEQNIYLYSVESDQVKSIPIGNDIPISITWSQDDSSLYYAAINLNMNNDSEWKDIIKYRSDLTCTIRHIKIDNRNDMPWLTTDIVVLPFLIGELLYNPIQEKLIFSSMSFVMQNGDDFQIYSLDLKNVSSIIKWTRDQIIKTNCPTNTR
ncbi:unnamed protein product [Rotaria sp. Silwood2]|nr:unnamed protein product [Rotaria sp. Silwood2]CAF4449562.1 unnamed protein product [Rotaria sp. Silwood2]